MQDRKRNGLKSIWFICGLLLAAGIASVLDGAAAQLGRAFGGELDLTLQPALAPPRPLSEEELSAAQIAWDYIENNTQWETGLVNSVDDFPSTTLWDQGSYVLGMASAYRLGVIDRDEYRDRMYLFLGAMQRIALIDAALPNKVYHTQNLLMTDYENQVVEEGIGWSALDIARLLMGLRVVERQMPELGPEIRRVLADWDFSLMGVGGELTGSSVIDGEIVGLQEGRIGYEQYGARAAAIWGMDVARGISAERILTWERVSGVDVPVDLRRANRFGAITPTLSEPYMLMALELGLDAESASLAERVYTAQKARYAQTNQLTFVSEDHLDQEPFFAYASVFSNGRSWAVVAEDGGHHPEMRTQSTKASFAWHAIWRDDYSRMGRDAVMPLGELGKGFYAGIYERDGSLNKALTLNTNAIILEALHYTRFGPLWSVIAENEIPQPTASVRPRARD